MKHPLLKDFISSEANRWALEFRLRETEGINLLLRSFIIPKEIKKPYNFEDHPQEKVNFFQEVSSFKTVEWDFFDRNVIILCEEHYCYSYHCPDPAFFQ